MSDLEQEYLAALDAIEDSPDPDRAEHVRLLTALSEIYADREQWEDALSAAETAQMIVDQFPDAFPGAAGSIARMQCLTAAAAALHGLNAVEDAEPLLREAMEEAESAFGRESAEAAMAAFNLSVALDELGQLDAARTLAAECERILTARLEADDERLAAVRDHLARIG